MSEVKVNKISPRVACGTVQLGDSGDTFTIPAGASITNSGTASGFGATGAASWNTTVKTGDFTAVAGEGYFVNTTSGAVNVTLPAGSAGSVIAIKDYAGTFDTNAVTLTRNGSDKIGGQAINATLSTEGTAVTLVFIDSTQGWLVTDSGLQSEAPTAQYICASVSGSCNTLATCGDFKVATFKGPGTFTVNSVGNASGSNTVDYLVVAGGAGGGQYTEGGAGGGGAGGFRMSNGTGMSGPQTSPLATPAAVPVSAQGYPITIGAGGSGGTNGRNSPPSSPKVCGTNGVNSTALSITSTGGGFGGGGDFPYPGSSGTNGNPGGSGGGGGGNTPSAGGTGAGNGNTPPVSPAQGNDGGAGMSCGSSASGQGGGGGGGAGATGTAYPATGCGGQFAAGPGGAGSFVVQSGFGGCNGTTGPVSGTRYFSGGGGGGRRGASPNGTAGAGGAGGGGAGTLGDSASNGVAGTVNTGGGGGGGGRGEISPTSPAGGNGGNGGSGIVLIRYKFQN